MAGEIGRGGACEACNQSNPVENDEAAGRSGFHFMVGERVWGELDESEAQRSDEEVDWRCSQQVVGKVEGCRHGRKGGEMGGLQGPQDVGRHFSQGLHIALGPMDVGNDPKATHCRRIHAQKGEEGSP